MALTFHFKYDEKKVLVAFVGGLDITDGRYTADTLADVFPESKFHGIRTCTGYPGLFWLPSGWNIAFPSGVNKSMYSRLYNLGLC